MRGDLSETTAADACRGLAGDGATGTLALGGLDGPGNIVFEQGRIVSAKAPTSTARLGDRLVGAGFLTEAELLDVLETQRSGAVRGRLGALLVERELVTHDAIRLFVQEQTLDALFEVLRWRYGSFAFQPGLDDDRSGVRVAMPVHDVLLVVGRRQEEWDELSRSIPDLAAIPTFSTGASTVSATLEPDEFAVLASVDGDRDVRELAADLGYNEIELARIIYGLTLLGVIDIRLPEDEIGAALDAALNQPATDADAAADGPASLARVIQLPTSRRPATADSDEPATVDEPADGTDGDDTTSSQPDDADGGQDVAPGSATAVFDGPAAPAPEAASPDPAAADAVGRDRQSAAPQPDAPQPAGHEQQPAPERPSDPGPDDAGHSLQERRAASMADLEDTSTSSFPDILRELREHSSTSRSPGAAAPDDEVDEAAPGPAAADGSDQQAAGSTASPDTSPDPVDPERTERAAPPGQPGDAPAAAGDAEPDDDAEHDEPGEPPTPNPRGDRDVSEFLRELSRLAGDDEPTAPRPARPSDRPSSSSSSGSSGSSGTSGDDDSKKRRRGLFGRG